MDQPEGTAEVGSTRFPFVNLKKAMERAEQLFIAANSYEALVPDAFTSWGYSVKSSGGFQTVSALKMYGLLNDLGANDTRKVVLTADALRYFKDERPEQRAALLAKFALQPKFLHSLWERWGSKPPADHIARSQLKVDLGLSEQNARSVLGIYNENIEYAGLKGDAKVEANKSLDEKKGASTVVETPPPRKETLALADNERELTAGLLARDTSFRLIVTGRIGVKEIDRLIAKLQLDRDILADEDTAGDDEDMNALLLRKFAKQNPNE